MHTNVQLLNETQVAKMLELKPGTLASWRINKRGLLPFVKMGGSVRYKLSDVETFVNNHTVQPQATAIR